MFGLDVAKGMLGGVWGSVKSAGNHLIKSNESVTLSDVGNGLLNLGKPNSRTMRRGQVTAGRTARFMDTLGARNEIAAMAAARGDAATAQAVAAQAVADANLAVGGAAFDVIAGAAKTAHGYMWGDATVGQKVVRNGLLGGAALGTRYATGGNLYQNSDGELDIAGLPGV